VHGPKAEFSFDDPIANSSQFVLPRCGVRSFERGQGRIVRRASAPGWRDDAVVRMPRTSMLSLSGLERLPETERFAACGVGYLLSAREGRSPATRLKALSEGLME